MAFDWIAGTALVVGIGSLALTWQSTKSAKKAIDTSIEIYEKQKEDSITEKKSFDDEKLNSIKIVIMYEITKIYLNYRRIMTSFEIIKKHDDFIILSELIASSEVLITTEHGDESSFNMNIPQICNDFLLLYDITMLDKKLALKLMGTDRLSIKIRETLNILNFIATNNKMDDNNKRMQAKIFVSDFNDNFITYGENIQDLYRLCTDNEESLESLYEYAKTKAN